MNTYDSLVWKDNPVLLGLEILQDATRAVRGEVAASSPRRVRRRRVERRPHR